MQASLDMYGMPRIAPGAMRVERKMGRAEHPHTAPDPGKVEIGASNLTKSWRNLEVWGVQSTRPSARGFGNLF